jgi:two-component system, LytTR family, sensor kinase
MEKDQIVGELRSGKPVPIRMRASSLKGFDFSGMDLTGADLSFSNLNEANFDGTTLRDARIRASNLSRASFRNADLTNADFSYSNLEDTDMTGAKLDGINLSFSNKGTSFQWSDLNLVALIQSQSWVGMVLAMLFGAIFVYGVSGIVYFTNLITRTSDPLMMQLNQFIVVNNLLTGILTVLFTSWLTPKLDHFVTSLWGKHVLLSLLITLGYMAFTTTLYCVWAQEIISQLSLRDSFDATQGTAPWYFYTLGPIGAANLFYYLSRQGSQLSRKISEQEYQLLNLEKLKTRAELSALQAKINPHFLYNSLNSIASLVHENPAKAEMMTVLLSKLFRYTTARTDDEYFDTIHNELEMVDTYLQIEQVRFGDRLNFTVQVDDPALESLMIPRFLLQPVVENAIKHGVSKLSQEGEIRVHIYEEGNWLYLCVQDNGPVFRESGSSGYGLRSIQDKLHLLYQDEASVEMHNQPTKHICIRIKKARLSSPLGATT